jgi:hypothetical protein
LAACSLGYFLLFISGRISLRQRSGNDAADPVLVKWGMLCLVHVVAEVSGRGLVSDHTDGLGCPVAKTNAAAHMISRTRYEPYGATAAGVEQGFNFNAIAKIMFDLFIRIVPCLSILGGLATGIYASYALVVGKVVVESRSAGRSVYEVGLHPGPFYGFVSFYFLCALIFLGLGLFWEKKAK